MVERLEIIIQAKDRFSKNFNKLKGSLPSLRKVAIGAGIAIAGTGAALAAMVKSTATAHDQIQKLSDQLGVTTEFLSGMRHAADISGVQVRTMEKAVQMLQVRVGEVGRGIGQAKDAFDDLGVSLYNTSGQLRTAEELMPDLAEAFHNMENATLRAEAASKIFGQRGMAMLQMFQEGKAGLKALTDEAERFGLIVTAEAGAGAAAFNDSLTKLTGAFKGIKNRIAELLLKPLAGAFNNLAEFMAKNRELIVQQLKDFAIGAFGLFKTTSIAIGGFIDDVKKHIERFTGISGIGGIKKKMEEIEDAISKHTGIELLPEEWVHRTQKSVDDYKHEIQRMKNLNSEMNQALALFEPPVITPKFDDDSIKSKVQGFFESIENAFKDAGDLPKFNIDLTAGGAGAGLKQAQENITALKALWSEYYQNESQRIDSWYNQQQEKYKGNKEALKLIDDIYLARSEEARAKDAEAENTKLATLRDMYNQHFLSQGEQLDLWYQQEQEKYLLNAEALAMIDEMFEARKKALEEATAAKKGQLEQKAFSDSIAAFKSFGKAGFRMAQAFEIAEATMSAHAAFTNTLKTAALYFPPPIPTVMAGAALAAGLARVAAIAAQKPPAAHTGLTSVPREQPYTLAARERVVSAPQNKDLTEFLATGTGPPIENLNVNVSILPNATNVDAFMSMDRNDVRDIVEDKIIGALSELADKGIKPRT